jgi:hypothetical protein
MVVTAAGADGEPADAKCPKERPLAIGGGGSAEDKGVLQISAPITKGALSTEGQKPTGWRVRSEAGRYTAYAICTSPGGKGSGEGEEESETPEKG